MLFLGFKTVQMFCHNEQDMPTKKDVTSYIFLSEKLHCLCSTIAPEIWNIPVKINCLPWFIDPPNMLYICLNNEYKIAVTKPPIQNTGWKQRHWDFLRKNPMIFYCFDQIKSILRDTILNNMEGKIGYSNLQHAKRFSAPRQLHFFWHWLTFPKS